MYVRKPKKIYSHENLTILLFIYYRKHKYVLAYQREKALYLESQLGQILGCSHRGWQNNKKSVRFGNFVVRGGRVIFPNILFEYDDLRILFHALNYSKSLE